MNKQQMIEKLKRIDEAAFFRLGESIKRKAEVVIIGGSALLLGDLSAKETTKDVDVLQISADEGVREILYSDPDINGMCQAYSQNVPYNFEDRLRRVELSTLAIDFFILSQEDLAVMKLYRWEDLDIADLTSRRFLETLNWALLEQLVYDPDEAASSRVAEPERDLELRQMRANFEQYRRRCGI